MDSNNNNEGYKEPNNKNFFKLVKWIFIITIAFVIIRTVLGVVSISKGSKSNREEADTKNLVSEPIIGLNEGFKIANDENIGKNENENVEITNDIVMETFVYDEKNDYKYFNIDVIGTDLNFKSTDEDFVSVSSKDLDKFEIQSSSDYLYIKSDEDNYNLFKNHYRKNLDIFIPSELVLVYSISTVDGNMIFEGLTGDNFNFDSTSGKTFLKDSKFSNLYIESVSGGTRLENVKSDGGIEILSVSGGVNLSNIYANNITIDSVSGGLEAIDILTTGFYSNSVSGLITAKFLNNDNIDVDINTVSGDIKCYFNKDLNISYTGTRKTNGKFVFNESGNNNLYISKISGSVFIEYN